MRTLTLDIVSPLGRQLRVDGLDEIVVRRREEEREFGSEVAILKGHAPLLMQVQPCTLRYRKGDETRVLDIDKGVLEVWDDTVTIALT